jgi:hypothetical protein
MLKSKSKLRKQKLTPAEYSTSLEFFVPDLDHMYIKSEWDKSEMENIASKNLKAHFEKMRDDYVRHSRSEPDPTVSSWLGAEFYSELPPGFDVDQLYPTTFLEDMALHSVSKTSKFVEEEMDIVKKKTQINQNKNYVNNIKSELPVYLHDAYNPLFSTILQDNATLENELEKAATYKARKHPLQVEKLKKELPLRIALQKGVNPEYPRI